MKEQVTKALTILPWRCTISIDDRPGASAKGAEKRKADREQSRDKELFPVMDV